MDPKQWAPFVSSEAATLLGAFSSNDATLTKRWLNGGRVEPKEARRTIGAEHEALVGPVASANSSPESLARQIYKPLSAAAHNDRGDFRDSVSVELRAFAYGTHPSMEIRAHYVAYARESLTQVVLEVGGGLARVWGPDWYERNIKPLLARLASTAPQSR